MPVFTKPEVLAPVGDFERLTAAVQFGADAVYLGGSEFGMRAASANFDEKLLKDAVEYAHQNGVKVYLTCNTLPRNDEIERLPEFLKYAQSVHMDAVIASDIGVLSLVKKHTPKMEVHISTQAGIVNYVTANEFYQMGAKRVVLARELSLEEISVIRQNTPKELDIEVFVHGAMCVSFSGRCLLSSYMTNRDANRGECAQPCRWGYHLVEEKRPNEHYPIYEDEKGTYILNAKDLCMIEYIDKLVEAGVTSLKIEGRAKSSYYVSVITNAYRNAVDEYLKDPSRFKLPDWILEETLRVSHRQYSTGFFFGRPENGQYYENGGYLRNFDVIAIVDEYKDGIIECTQRNKFYQGDEVEVLEPLSKPFSMKIDKLFDKDGKEIADAAHPLMKLKIPFGRPVKPGAIIRKSRED
ncbi:MAG: putative protease [Oscillospiraceae bacterium]|jgi:putative protease|nr:putative protease [Oscillospiraceae bacterium]